MKLAWAVPFDNAFLFGAASGQFPKRFKRVLPVSLSTARCGLVMMSFRNFIVTRASNGVHAPSGLVCNIQPSDQWWYLQL